MISINDFNEKNKRYLPHDLNTRYFAVISYRNGNSSNYVCRKYHISKSSLSEIKWINDYLRRNPNITLCELWYKLKLNKGYSRHPGSLYRFLKKIGFYQKLNIKNTSKYVPKKYDAPKNVGQKWQIDVKLFLKNANVITCILI